MKPVCQVKVGDKLHPSRLLGRLLMSRKVLSNQDQSPSLGWTEVVPYRGDGGSWGAGGGGASKHKAETQWPFRLQSCAGGGSEGGGGVSEERKVARSSLSGFVEFSLGRC